MVRVIAFLRVQPQHGCLVRGKVNSLRWGTTMLLLFLTSYFFSLSSLFHVHLSFSSSFYFSSAPNLNFLIFISNALSTSITPWPSSRHTSQRQPTLNTSHFHFLFNCLLSPISQYWRCLIHNNLGDAPEKACCEPRLWERSGRRLSVPPLAKLSAKQKKMTQLEKLPRKSMKVASEKCSHPEGRCGIFERGTAHLHPLLYHLISKGHYKIFS